MGWGSAAPPYLGGEGVQADDRGRQQRASGALL
jgi:hypothetical protein